MTTTYNTVRLFGAAPSESSWLGYGTEQRWSTSWSFAGIGSGVVPSGKHWRSLGQGRAFVRYRVFAT